MRFPDMPLAAHSPAHEPAGGAKVLSMSATPAARRISAKHTAVSTLVALQAVGHMMITDPLYPCFFTMFLLLMCWSARLRNDM